MKPSWLPIPLFCIDIYLHATDQCQKIKNDNSRLAGKEQPDESRNRNDNEGYRPGAVTRCCTWDYQANEVI